MAERQPQLHPALLRLSEMISPKFIHSLGFQITEFEPCLIYNLDCRCAHRGDGKRFVAFLELETATRA